MRFFASAIALGLGTSVLAAPNVKRQAEVTVAAASIVDPNVIADTASPLPSATTIVGTSTVLTTTRSIIAQTLVPGTPAAVAPAVTVAGAAAIASVTIRGTGTLPKPTSFVKNNKDGRLFLDGKVYRIAGPNIYWLGLDQDPTAYPDPARVREAMAIAVAMGANTIRVQTFGISTGNSLSFQPSKGVFNQQAFQRIAYGVFAAREYGLRLIIPLTDQYQYYLGGKCDFVKFAGASTSNYCNAFYTNSNALAAFKLYIKALLTTVNPYTGKTLAQDPTILAWETGNEFGAYMLKQGAPPLSFTQGIATYIKSLAPNHLVVDGTDGISQPSAIPGLRASAVDIVSNHYYPPDTNLLNSDFSASSNAGKVLLAGEIDWTSSNTPAFLSAIESKRGAGDMLWSVWGHTADCSSYVQHDDGYSLYYPYGITSAQQSNVQAIVNHYYKQTGRSAPNGLPGVACPQPVF